MKDIDELKEQIKIANRLKAIRSAKRITQERMAEMIDISYSTYVKLENASHGITTKNLVKICKILNVSADLILLGDTGDHNINFAEYMECIKLLSDEGINEIENNILLIKKLKDTEQENMLKIN